MPHDGTGRLDLSADADLRDWRVSLEPDVSPGEWVVERTTGRWHEVGALIPSGFAAYARIFHPAYSDQGRVEVTWAEVAAANGRIDHPAMDWVTITGSERYLHGDDQPGIWDEEPREGSLPVRQSQRLIRVLAAHTDTPEACWFALWEGFGRVAIPRDAGKLMMRNRPMVLFSGAISDWIEHQRADPYEQSPSLWWPDDRAWCVATDVDLMTTYVGGSDGCIAAVTGSDGIEAKQITLDQPTTWDKDTVNPNTWESGGGNPSPG